VQISSLRIDRFGVWNDLDLKGVSEELNVIYGPLDSDQTAIIQFLRAMLFGFQDEIRERYMPADFGAAGGSITVRGQFGCQTIHRHDDGDGRDRLFIENNDGSVVGNPHLQPMLAGATPSVFDRVFMPGVGTRPDVAKLIDVAVAHGLEVIGDCRDPKRFGQLCGQLANKQQTLADSPPADQPLEELLEARQNLTRKVNRLESLRAQQRASFNQYMDKLASEIQDLEEQHEELAEELNAVDAEIKTREEEKLQKEQAIHEEKLQQERQLAERRQRLTQMDAQLELWGRVLKDVEARSVELNQNTTVDESLDNEVDGDPRRCLRRLEKSINKLGKLIAAGEYIDGEGDRECGTMPSTMTPALGAMREDIYRLCIELSRREVKSQRIESRSELNQLRRCETELRQAIQGLSLRRRKLVAELSETHDVDQVVVDPAHARLCQCSGHPEHIEAAPAFRDVPTLDEEVVAILNSEIRRLAARREEIRADIDTIQDVLDQSRQRLAQLRLDQERDLRHELLKAKRDELESIEQKIDDMEHRRELTDAVAALEEETRLLEPTDRASVLSEASDLLRHLTGGELDSISITGERAVLIRNRRENEVVYHQMGSQSRDQAYLSLCLAIVAAHAREGVRLPVVLQDDLLHVDSEDLETTASLLSDFAGRGHQVFVFTQHRYVADLFRALDVPVRELPRPVAIEAAPVDVDEEKVLSDAQRSEVNRQLNAIAEETAEGGRLVDHPAWNAEEFPGELTDRVRIGQPAEPQSASKPESEQSESRFFLQESSPIDEAPSSDPAIAECFRKIGVLQIRDLLHIEVDEAADRLRHAGITAVMIRRWQAEALLTCRVARLRPYDARILVACGITTPGQLARIDVDELRRRVELFGSTETGQRMFRSGTHSELQRVKEWIRGANDDADSEAGGGTELRAA